VLVDPVTRALACIHAGWGGTVRGVTPATIAALRQLGVDPANLVAGIGPSIAPTRYEVGPEVAEAARDAFGDRSAAVLHPPARPGGRWLFDLWAAAVVQLAAGGVRKQNIHLAGCDTGPGTPFFSHRSEAPTGRFALVARLTEASPKELP
jgi:copper oxidase (laccase) domain-containing protein